MFIDSLTIFWEIVSLFFIDLFYHKPAMVAEWVYEWPQIQVVESPRFESQLVHINTVMDLLMFVRYYIMALPKWVPEK